MLGDDEILLLKGVTQSPLTVADACRFRCSIILVLPRYLPMRTVDGPRMIRSVREHETARGTLKRSPIPPSSIAARCPIGCFNHELRHLGQRERIHSPLAEGVAQSVDTHMHFLHAQ